MFFNPDKLSTKCQLCLKRMSIVRNRKALQVRKLEGEVAELMLSGADKANARIRVEELIRQEMMTHAYARLETYLLLVQTRAEMLKKAKEPPLDMVEAVCSLLFAAERVRFDLDEIPAIRDILLAKFRLALCARFGKDFVKDVVEENLAPQCGVNADIVAYLSASPAPADEKLQRLVDIASKYGVEFDRDAAAAEMLPANVRMPRAAHPYDRPAVPQETRPVAPPPSDPQAWVYAAPSAPSVLQPPAPMYAAKPQPPAGTPPLPPPVHTRPAHQVQSPPVHQPSERCQAGPAQDPGWAPLPPATQTLGQSFGERLDGCTQWIAKERSGSVESGSGTPARGSSLPLDPGSDSPPRRSASPSKQQQQPSVSETPHNGGAQQAKEEDDLARMLRELKSM